MTKEEALEVLRTIDEIYPRFNLTKRKASLLVPQLMKMDYNGVMKNLSGFVIDNPYPPMLSEIAAYRDEGNSHLEEMRKWQEEAKKVTPEMKKHFMEQLEKLVQKKSGD